MLKTWSTRRWLISILAVAVLLRVGMALYLGNQVEILPGIYDQVSYHNLALRLEAGHGFTHETFWWPATRAGEQTAHWSYVYTYFLLFVYWIFGPNPLAARLIQAVLVGILHPLLAYFIGKQVFNRAVGLAAAAITAIYIYFVYYSAALMTEPFYITTILASMYMTIKLSSIDAQTTDSKPSYDLRWAIALGIVMGLAVLLRQLFLLLVPVFLGWIVFVRWRQQRPFSLISFATPIFVIILMILPFTLFNYQRFDRFVLLNTNAGFAFFWGNHPIHGTNFYAILPDDGPSYQELIPAKYRQLDEAAMDQALLSEGIGFIVDDPLRYLQLSLNRAKDYFVFWPSAESSLLSNLSRVFSFGIFLPFMIYGVILAIFNRRWNTELKLTSPVVLLLLYSSIYTVIHLLTWTLIRYRLPVDAILVIFAGVAFVDLSQRIAKTRWHSTNSLADASEGGFSSS